MFVCVHLAFVLHVKAKHIYIYIYITVSHIKRAKKKRHMANSLSFVSQFDISKSQKDLSLCLFGLDARAVFQQLSVMNIIKQNYKCRMEMCFVNCWLFYREWIKSDTHFQLFFLVMAKHTSSHFQAEGGVKTAATTLSVEGFCTSVCFSLLLMLDCEWAGEQLWLKGQVWGRMSGWEEELIQ